MNEFVISSLNDLSYLRFDSFRCYQGCSNYNCCNRCCGGSLYPCPIFTNCSEREIF